MSQMHFIIRNYIFFPIEDLPAQFNEINLSTLSLTAPCLTPPLIPLRNFGGFVVGRPITHQKLFEQF